MAFPISIPREQLEDVGFNVLEQIVWDKNPVLKPGLDFQDGTVYMTLPARYRETKKVGRGAGAKEEIVTTSGLACITSEREQFLFRKEEIEALGFTYPEHVLIPEERRWSTEGINAFLQKQDSPPNPKALWASIRKVYEEHIEFADEMYYDIMPLFIMGTYVFRLFGALGYLHFNGTAASGKSQNLRIIDALAFNPMWSSSLSAAALFRSVAGSPGTVCIDEAEGFDGERGEELRRILNAGYLDGSTVKRAEKGANDQFVVSSYSTFGPKAIASINVMEPVIGSRCLIVAMRPAIRRIPEFKRSTPRCQSLRDQLYLWAMHNGALLGELNHVWQDDKRNTRAPLLIARQWEITQLYIVLADYIDADGSLGLVDRLVSFFGTYFTALQANLDATDRIRLLLKCLPRVLARTQPWEGGYYPVKAIHEIVSEYLDTDQHEYFKTRTIIKHLDVLGFKKKRPNKNGVQVWLDPAAVRFEFTQRRVEPFMEDEAWLAGDTDYTIETPPEAQAFNWDDVEEAAA